MSRLKLTKPSADRSSPSAFRRPKRPTELALVEETRDPLDDWRLGIRR